MLTQNVTTISNNAPTAEQDELSSLASYFELLSQIDQRLKNEDPEYREIYYPDTGLGKET